MAGNGNFLNVIFLSSYTEIKQYRDFTAINQIREQLVQYHNDVYANKKDRLLQYDLYKDNHAEILIGGNFNHVVNFSQWINEKLLMQTDISLVS